MADNTKIQWAEASWTPIRARNLKTGKIGWHCTHASEGCRNCYAEGMNLWRGTVLSYKPGHEKDIEVFLDDAILKLVLQWRRPRLIFTCSMTDLFGDFVSEEMIDTVFAAMALAKQHTFQVLTKRSERMRGYAGSASTPGRIWAIAMQICGRMGYGPDIQRETSERISGWPLPNVWMGVSVEDQENAQRRIPDLLAAPAAVRFISYEPALDGIDLENPSDDGSFLRAWGGEYVTQTPGLDWVIVGGESGYGARPFDIAWARKVVQQCANAGVACFVKQLGAKPYDSDMAEIGDPRAPLTTRIVLKDGKGGDWDEWEHKDIKVREYPARGAAQ